MKILTGYPPNYSEIRKAFPWIKGRPGILFAYGDAIYNPSRGKIPDELIAHETVHMERQAGHPEEWWTRYIASPLFRLDEEVMAHRAEYRHLVEHGGKLLHRNAVIERLTLPLYGLGLTKAKARALIA